MEVNLSDIIGAAFEIRNASDYDDMFIAVKSDTLQQIQNAEYFYKVISEYVFGQFK